MCKSLNVKNGGSLLQYFIACNDSEYYMGGNAWNLFPSGLHETPSGYSREAVSCMLYVDEKYNIILPMNGNVEIILEPLPKAIYLLFLRHPDGILLKNISDYREELKYIYRSVSCRVNPTVISRLIDNVTNPINNNLNKNISVIRAAFYSKLPPDEAQQFIPIPNRGGEQRVLLNALCIKWHEKSCL